MGNSVVGERVRIRRKQKGLTLDDIANEIGVAKSTIQRYETGSIERLKLPVIEAIARVLEVNPAWLVGKSDEMETRPKETSDASSSGKRELSGDKEDDHDIYIIRRAKSRMTAKEWEKQMRIMEASFGDYFSDDYVDDDLDE